jgi:hypothetical protein
MITPYNNGANHEAWYRNIMQTPTDKVSLPAKAVAIAIVTLVNDARACDSLMWQGHFKVYDWQIAQAIGMHRVSVVRLRKQVAHCFSIVQQNEWNDDGKFWKVNYYLPGENILLGILDVDNKLNTRNGQKNYTCKECGSERIEHVITHTYKCMECGHIHTVRRGEMLP